MFQRRNFIAGFAAGVTALAMPGRVLAAAGRAIPLSGSPAGAGNQLSKAALQAAVGQGFRCTDPHGRSYELLLVEIIDGPQAPGLDQFRAVFSDISGAAQDTLEGDLHIFDNSITGAFLLRLNEPLPGKNRYVAQFTLLA